MKIPLVAPVSALTLISCIAYFDNAVADVNIRIDAAAHILKQATNLKPRREGVYDCPTKCDTGLFGGLCAIEPRCVSKITISNLEIVEEKGIDFRYPELADIPIYRENQSISFDNCLSDEWNWEETLNIETTQQIESRNSTVLKDVSNRTISLSIEYTIAKKLGLKFSEGFSRTTTIESSSEKTHVQTKTFTLEKPLRMTIPALTRREIIYSDGRTRAQIAAHVELLLDGDVIEQHVTHPGGWVWRNISRKRLSRLVPEEEPRTVAIRALIDVSGSDRALTIRLREKKLKPSDDTCRD